MVDESTLSTTQADPCWPTAQRPTNLHREHTTTTVNGEQREYVLRTTQVYRREDGTWKVVHRHADNEASVQGP